MDNKRNVIDDIAEIIDTFTFTDLTRSVIDIFDALKDPVQISQAKALFLHRAEELGERKAIQNIITSCEREKKNAAKRLAAQVHSETVAAFIDLDKNGEPAETIANFYNIMTIDGQYRSIRYNVMSGRAEVMRTQPNGDQLLDSWDDTDDAASQHFIEETYHLYSPQKHQAALRMLFRSREYNPIKDLVDTFEWDGVNRIEGFLTKWMLVDDTPYTREVSRLIFAGGINRLYRPGCKFDDVPVLIGPNQGEGKSTLVEWLSLNKEWFGIVKHIEGKDAIEEITGKWICEIPELSAFKRADDVEAIKAFVTIDRDRYRRPYDRYPVDYPRRCIFIGTTNQEQFLVDKTGNRRFYPVTVYQRGYYLWDHEEECKADIIQCWAEARERFKKGEMQPFACKELAVEYQKQQELAMEDDYRVGLIEDYLRKFGKGERVCCLQIFRECFGQDDNSFPKRNESNAISQIMGNQKEWKRIDKSSRFGKYGTQKGWLRISGNSSSLVTPAEDENDLPF